MVFARAAYSHSASLNAAAKRGCHCRAGRPADHTAPFLLPSCAGLNGATARGLSEPHTSGFAARPKPPPERAAQWCTKRRSLGLGRNGERVHSIKARVVNRCFETEMDRTGA